MFQLSKKFSQFAEKWLDQRALIRLSVCVTQLILRCMISPERRLMRYAYRTGRRMASRNSRHVTSIPENVVFMWSGPPLRQKSAITHRLKYGSFVIGLKAMNKPMSPIIWNFYPFPWSRVDKIVCRSDRFLLLPSLNMKKFLSVGVGHEIRIRISSDIRNLTFWHFMFSAVRLTHFSADQESLLICFLYRIPTSDKSVEITLLRPLDELFLQTWNKIKDKINKYMTKCNLSPSGHDPSEIKFASTNPDLVGWV